MLARQPFCAGRAPPGAVRTRIPAARALPTSKTVPSVVLQQDAEAWGSFAERFSGEWEGVSAAFNGDGTPQPLPERFVPGAYREWGVELFDWQTQCSCKAGAAVGEIRRAHAAACSVLRRLMPTVGCEADAVAFTEEVAASTAVHGADVVGAGAGAAAAMAFLPDGSYASGPAAFDAAGASRLRFEACFPAPPPASAAAAAAEGKGGAGGASGAPRYRVKVAQELARNWVDGSWRVSSVELHRERYDGPYTGRQELAGCGGGQPAISNLPAVAAEAMLARGTWQAEAAAVLDAAASGGAPLPAAALPAAGGGLLVGGSGGGGEGDTVLTLLPLGAWSAVRIGAEGRLYVEAGVLSTEGARRQVAACQYDAGHVKSVVLSVERAAGA